MEIALIVLAFGVLLYLFRAQHLDSKKTTRLLDLIDLQRQEAQDERREMVNRLQFPDRMPQRPSQAGRVNSNISPESRRALTQVGTVAPQVNDGD